MTDNFTPVEFSWNWGIKDGPVVIRYSIEPIGLLAGTSADPINDGTADRVVRQFQSLLPTADLQWYDHFSRALCLTSEQFRAVYLL